MSAQMIDVNSNAMSDVWEWVYGASGVSTNADSDGDNVINMIEATSGTGPFDSNSLPKISDVVKLGTNTSATLPVQLGKLYQLQSLTSLDDTNWVDETNIVVRVGTNLTLTALAMSESKYLRISISDVDTDGDGLSDWEEYKLGLDPFDGKSNNEQDSNGIAMGDSQFALTKITPQNVITITATDPTTMQPDANQAPTDLGGFTVTRGGFPLNSITVNLGVGGPGVGFATAGVDYAALPSSVALPAGTSSTTIALTPLSNTNLATPVIAQLQLLSGANYTVGAASNASVVIYPSATPTGAGLTGMYFTNSHLVYGSVTNFNPTNLFLTRIDPGINFNWTNGTSPNLSNGLYTVRWTGQVQPQYSEIYFFDTITDDGVKLWVNDQLLINKWQNQNNGTEWTNAIVLQGGTRYNIKMEYLQVGSKAKAQLYWFSPNQSKQIIPSNRLYPTNSFGGSNAPTVITSALSTVGFVGQPFTFTVTAANSPLGFTANGLPPGLSFNTNSGLINGTPTLAGDYQVSLAASNAIGVGSSIVNITIFNTLNSVVQEIWTGVPGANIADIPTDIPATFTNTLATLEGVTNYNDNYAERVRGFFIAPTNGNYYFWIAASDSAELWISNDGEPVNKVRRAWVTPTNNPTAPGQNGTLPRQWNLQSSQKSPWLALVGGQKYYIEILHKAGAATNDNWSVAWLQDPAGTNNTPLGVMPGYLLTRFYPPLPVNIPGILYSANMLAQNGAISSGIGSATLRLSADGTQAVLKRSFSGLSSAFTGEHIHSDTYLGKPSQIIFDIDDATPQADGSYIWDIEPLGLLSVAEIQEIIRTGKSYINIHTANYPGGEINGHFTLANGSQTFTPPPTPPAWTDDHANTNAVIRFLTQATFGANSNEIASVQTLGYEAWIDNQFALPVTRHLPLVLANGNLDPSTPYPSSLWFNTWWQQSITAPDQLRQRVAFALSEIMVISENGILLDNARALSHYYDALLDNSFGNFRELLEAMTLTPGMGLYLDMKGNDKGSIITGLHANENFAREIKQLFSIGLYRLWPDGTLILNSQGNLVPTYDQAVVEGFAKVFTGWHYYQTNQANGRLPSNWYPSRNYTNPMVLVPSHHDLGTKLLLDNVMLPQAWGNQGVSSTTNDAYCLQDLESAMDSINNNQNVGPFICRQLIQRLVTSNPNRDYLYRVVQKFNDNGSGVRGDMQAVVKAILLDPEARSTNSLASPSYGKQREPLLRVTELARALPSPPNLSATYAESGTPVITITTPAPHRMNNKDVVTLAFTDTSGNPAPPNQPYSVTNIGANTFTVIAPNLQYGSYAQNSNFIVVNITGHGLVAGYNAYLSFTTGGAVNGQYQVVSNSANSFTVATADSLARSGTCVLPKISPTGFVQSGTNVTVTCSTPHGLNTNDTLFCVFGAGLPTDGQYQVIGIPDANHFTLLVTNSASQTIDSFTIYPLVAPSLTRSGNVTLQWNTWKMGATDTSQTFNLGQSPMGAPTVFNFFFPDFQFPGTLASAGLTTPEFQLTSDTTVALQMNFLQAGILGTTTSSNGLSSYNQGNGAIVLDIGPWMSTNYTAGTNVNLLLDSMNSLLAAGQLSFRAKTNIFNYVTNTVNFPYNSTPTQGQMRDRVRAVVHLIVCSPDFTIQK